MTPLHTEDDTARFDARKDAWLVVTLVVISIVMVWMFARLVLGPAGPATKILLSLVLLSASTFSLWVLLGTSYQLTSTALLVRVGPLRWRIPLASIVEISPDRNLASSAALSYERLHIRLVPDAGDVYISPRDRRRFLDALQARCPQLQRHEGRLVREVGVQHPV